MCEGWKVLLRKNRRSISDWSGKNEFAITYPVNVEMFPTLTGSKLFFFKKYADAVCFDRASCSDCIIVKCIAKNPKKKKYVAAMREDIKYSWEITGISSLLNLAPEGTYVADSITCLE